ncbi:MAG: hypothetical protein EPO12_08985 [Aquabacterium sp.]|jgi:apolipoprotein D and lipocalin family protein|nr:MAG: hypothetical protein EPO12_08985 [Aquabacterium sp.]
MKLPFLPYLSIAAAAVGCALLAPPPAEDWATLDLPQPLAQPVMAADLRSAADAAVPQVLRVAQRMPELRPVQGFELKRYLGTWHEIARLPGGPADEACVASVAAQYLAAADDSVSVLQRCRTAGNRMHQSMGVATQPQPGVGLLRVSTLPRGLGWLPIARTDYWVLDVDAQYRYALVGTPDRRALWILSREAVVPQQEFERLLTRAKDLGFATGSLMLTSQDQEAGELPMLVVQR